MACRQTTHCFLGNGFSRAVFNNIPSWEILINPSTNPTYSIENYTFLCKMQYILGKNKNEAAVKEALVQKLKDVIVSQNIREGIRGLNRFGEYLRLYRINNIITTNYDRGIEFILCNYCEYKEVEKPLGLIPEDIYSIRTYKILKYKNGNHKLRLWKMHGDVSRPKSIMLGFDHYCGSLAKLSNYIKGTYCSKDAKIECRVNIENKCINNAFDRISWAELFFSTNVFIIGLGLDFSEIDIWWLLNKHVRIKTQNPHHLQNSIYYFYNEQYDNPEEKKDIFQMLSTFCVEQVSIRSDKDYIRNIFYQIGNAIGNSHEHSRLQGIDGKKECVPPA